MLKYSFKSFQCTCSIKLITPSFFGNTHSGIAGSTSKATELGWLLGVGKVTAGFSTTIIQVATTLSWNSESLALVASWTAYSSIRGSSAWLLKILDYKHHELKLVWTHAQLAWWYLELRSDRDVICFMNYKPNLVLGWIVVELTSIQFCPMKKTFESSWVLIPLRKGEDSLLSLVSYKQFLPLLTTLLIELSTWSCLSSPWKMVLVVDCHRMMTSKTMMPSIGECRVGQT